MLLFFFFFFFQAEDGIRDLTVTGVQTCALPICVRPAPLVLLGHPQRFLRRDREAPGRPPDLGPAHAGALRREEPALRDDAVPLPDRGSYAHRAATDEQRGPGGLPGARRGARGHAVAPHQLTGRNALT